MTTDKRMGDLVYDTLFDHYVRMLSSFTEQVLGELTDESADYMLSVLADAIAQVGNDAGIPLAGALAINLLDKQEDK